MKVSEMIQRTTVFIALTVFLWGCGTANNDAPSLDTAGKHPAGWVAANGGNHRLGFRASPGQCRQCHGSDLLIAAGSGGIAGVNCSSSSFQGLICHANGHLPRIAPHAVPFTNPSLHGPAAKQDLIFCQGCHGTPNTSGAGSNPRFNVQIGALVKGCEDCHNLGTAHPSLPAPDSAPWRGLVTHRDAGNLTNACALCHGAALDGVGGVGPACSACHTAGSPLIALNCTSCHGNPPSGSLFPNISGVHRVHNALNNITGTCSSCHDGAGIGTLNHFNQVLNVAIAAAYNAQSGTASFNAAALNCVNVSCHGGEITPTWKGGTINVAVQCTSCHRSRSISAQFNSYFSGMHVFHVTFFGVNCTECHDTAKLAVSHFVGLNTPAFEGVPAATIRNAVRYVGGSCLPDNTAGNFDSTLTIGCHRGDISPRNWTTP